MELKLRPAPLPVSAPPGRTSKLERLIALAVRFDAGAGRGQGLRRLARLGQVSRARVTPIMNLLNLAPDLQEQILCMPAVTEGRDPLKEWQVRPVVAEPLWARQRQRWRALGV